MSFELFIAKRYALTKRKEQFITTISILSALGILVGVAALICVLSVFNGFSKVVTDILVNFDPHVRINAAADSAGVKFVPHASVVIAQLKENPDIQAIGPVIKEKAVIVHYTLPRVASVIGIDPSDLDRVSGIGKTIQSGEMKLDDSSIVLGQVLADNLAVSLGDTVQLFSPHGMERILTEPINPKSKKFIVKGIFGANNREYDAINSYININAARDLFELPADAATQIDIRLHEIERSQSVKGWIASKLSNSSYSIQTWYDLHTDLYNVMEIERWIAFVILILIVAVASFSIFSALTLTVFEKKRDIGLLTALGAEGAQIRKIFLAQGLITGIAGVIGGCIIGLGIVWAQQEFKFFKLDSSVYIIPAMPVELHLLDFCVVSIGALALVILAAYFPSKRAARTSPASALRWE